jgi:hypothetical protein
MAAVICGGAGVLGTATGESKIPLSGKAVADAGASAPYIVLMRWGDGVGTGSFYDRSTGAATATYANAAVRFYQDSVSNEWLADVPALQPDGEYWAIVRDGTAGAETKTDADICRVYISWSRTGGLKINKTDVFVSF